MNWQEVVKLLRDVFAYADIQIVVYTLNENVVHAMSAEGNANFYADVGKERYSNEVFLGNHELDLDLTKKTQIMKTDFWRTLRSPLREISQWPTFWALPTIPAQGFYDYVEEIDLQYWDLTDEEVIVLIVFLVDARDVYSQRTFDFAKTWKIF